MKDNRSTSTIDPEHASLTERFLDDRFPRATAAIVAGSTGRGNRTPTSDIDLLILAPVESFPNGTDSLATSVSYEGELFEVFAYTENSYRRWADESLGLFRPTIVHMLVEGVALRADDRTEVLRTEYSEVLRRGPQIEAHALDLRRYAVADLIDDLVDARDPLEQRTISAELFEQAATLLLLSNGCWIGHGKYLARRLREFDSLTADALAEAFLDDDPAALVTVATRIIHALGGRLPSGFVR